MQFTLHIRPDKLIYRAGTCAGKFRQGDEGMADREKNEKRAEERRLLETEVAFHTENDIYMASTVDISGMGIRIVTEKPIDILFQIIEKDRLVQIDAKLVWARVKDDGSMEYGLRF
jgi:hypothetical protein